MKFFNIKIAFVFAILLLSTACARDYAYRPALFECEIIDNADPKACEQNTLLRYKSKEGSENLLGFVEYDDQGQLRNPGQLNLVWNEFAKIAGQQEVLIIVYVHGWHHNASYDDENVSKFNQLLTKITQVENHTGHRKVLGLYIGWRGESILVPGINLFTFWERKDTAHKVGSNRLAELLLKMEEIVNIKNTQATIDHKQANSHMVVIGHSFGGAVVFTSLQQILADRFIDSHAGKIHTGPAKGFGDLVVLLNPAFEALRYTSLYELSQERCSYFEDQLPTLAILTSEADWATGLAFPLGRFFSTLFESHDEINRATCPKQNNSTISEGEADLNTVGHFQPYITHALHSNNSEASANENHVQTLKPWTSQAKTQTSQSYDFGETNLENLGLAHPLNPFLNILVDSDLIPSHNDIWGDEVVNFLRDFIGISTAKKNN